MKTPAFQQKVIVARIMNDMWAKMDAVVLAHDGYIDKHFGDALMALWGLIWRVRTPAAVPASAFLAACL